MFHGAPSHQIKKSRLNLPARHVKSGVYLEQAGSHEISVAQVSFAILKLHKVTLETSGFCELLLICSLEKRLHVDLQANTVSK